MKRDKELQYKTEQKEKRSIRKANLRQGHKALKWGGKRKLLQTKIDDDQVKGLAT